MTLTLGFAALRFLGQGSLMLSSANLVAQWFSQKRGFALSLMALGFSASIAVHPPLAQWLIDQVGWREAWLWLGLMTWALLLPLFALLVQNKPEDLGLVPDGRAAAGGEAPRSPMPRAPTSASRSPQALRTPAFWIIALSFATFSMLVTGLFFHQVAIYNDRGIGSQTAAQLFSVSALTMVLAMPLFGRLLDRLPTRPMFACAMLTMTAAMLALVMVDDVPSASSTASSSASTTPRSTPTSLPLAALVRPPPPRQHPGHGADHRGGRRLARPDPARRRLRPVRQLPGRAAAALAAAGGLRDRDPLHAPTPPRGLPGGVSRSSRGVTRGLIASTLVARVAFGLLAALRDQLVDERAIRIGDVAADDGLRLSDRLLISTHRHLRLDQVSG